MDFQAFPKIERLDKQQVLVTQKLHGTNASVWIFRNSDGNLDLKTGKRTGFCTPVNDNFGFAQFVYSNKQEFISKLGEGVWYGEWCGPGINSGEGLKEKRLALFDVYKLEDRPLPDRVDKVPILWQGQLADLDVEQIMVSLKNNGSFYVTGFTRPEGIVVKLIHGPSYKYVFEAEDTQWRAGSRKELVDRIGGAGWRSIPVDHLLQPIRLQKLLSRDESYVNGYPKTLSKLASDYVADLIDEGQIVGTDDEIGLTKKALGNKLYGFLKEQVELTKMAGEMYESNGRQ